MVLYSGSRTTPVLGECDDLKVDDAAEFVANTNKGLHGFKPRLAVHIGEGADVEAAVKSRQSDGAPRVIDNPAFGRIFVRSRSRAPLRPWSRPHAVALIGLERLLLHIIGNVHTLQRCKCGLTEQFRHQIAARVYLGRGLAIQSLPIVATTLSLIPISASRSGVTAQPCVADDNIEYRRPWRQPIS